MVPAVPVPLPYLELSLQYAYRAHEQTQRRRSMTRFGFLVLSFLIEASLAACSLSAHATSATGSLLAPRTAHTATLLPSGGVLVVGGSRGWSGTANTTEIYDPLS